AALGAFVLWLTFFITPFHYTDCFSVRQIGYGGTSNQSEFFEFQIDWRKKRWHTTVERQK
ncbi:MAG: hypothetical protein E6066_18955, partial [Oscillospiraceae bacterium]|nr:hypothetical protein [Oscillospiraceae bacterium]